MKRFVIIAALCAPVAALATAYETGTQASANVTEIRVAADELATCQETLRKLEERPVVTDEGWRVPDFMTSDSLPTTVCVVSA